MDIPFLVENTLIGLRHTAAQYVHTCLEVPKWNQRLRKGGVVDLSSKKLLPPHSFLAINAIWLVVGFRQKLGVSEYTETPILNFLSQTNIYLVIALMYLSVVLISHLAVQTLSFLTGTRNNAFAPVFMYVAGWIYFGFGLSNCFSLLYDLVGPKYSETKNIILGILSLMVFLVVVTIVFWRVLPVTSAVISLQKFGRKPRGFAVGFAVLFYNCLLLLTSAIALLPAIDEILTQRKNDGTVDCYTQNVDLEKSSGRLSVSMVLLSRNRDPYIINQEESFLRFDDIKTLQTNGLKPSWESVALDVLAMSVEGKPTSFVVLSPKTPQAVSVEVQLNPEQLRTLTSPTNTISEYRFYFSARAKPPKSGELIQVIQMTTNAVSGAEESLRLIMNGKGKIRVK